MNHVFELIPLTIQTKGEVLASNIDEFRELVRGALANLNRDLKTDEEFGQAELDVKALKGAEDAVKSAKERALADAEQLQALFATLDETAQEIRAPRLELEKLITKRKEEVKSEQIVGAMKRLVCAPRLRASVYGEKMKKAVSGKRSLKSMHSDLEKTVITENAIIEQARVAIQTFVWEHGNELVMDAEDLEVKGPEAVNAELRRRLDLKKAEDERKRLAAEAEKAKAEVAEMKREAAEATKPPLPPIAGGPYRRRAESPPTKIEAVGEWDAFKDKVLAAFGPLRDARAALRCPENQAKAQGFAEAVARAWKEVA